MRHIEPLSISYLREWLLWDSMVNAAWLENSYRSSFVGQPRVSTRDWHDLLLREKRDLKRNIVTYMLRSHAERFPPMMLLSEEEALAYQSRTDPQGRPGSS